ncbi:MAG: hypothetical protein LBI03_04305 [Clostridiales bacterium]|jgi:hypothetical protein|nr:hypothetical protein [Clostridiales bacterium]
MKKRNILFFAIAIIMMFSILGVNAASSFRQSSSISKISSNQLKVCGNFGYSYSTNESRYAYYDLTYCGKTSSYSPVGQTFFQKPTILGRGDTRGTTVYYTEYFINQDGEWSCPIESYYFNETATCLWSETTSIMTGANYWCPEAHGTMYYSHISPYNLAAWNWDAQYVS